LNCLQIRFTDFDVVVQVKPHAFLKREGQDIIYEKVIPYTTAVLGGTVHIPLIEGNIDLKVAPGTPSGKMVRLTGKGIPYPQQPHKWGDFYVVYKINVPTRVTAKARKLLEELITEQV
jgi:molecular chaperone DnaJ